MSEDPEIPSRGQSSNTDADNESGDPFSVFSQMEDVYEKLKLLNHEKEFIKEYKLRPLNRHYFALQTNPGEQFYAFSLLAAWLIRKCGTIIDTPQEYDDPNSTIAVILDAARKEGIPVDFSPGKLKQGYGKFVVMLLNQLVDRVLEKTKFKFKKLFPPVEVADEETIVEDDSELLLERIEEEMVAEEMDSEDDEDILFNVDDLTKLNSHSRKADEVLQTNITNDEWQLEVERVLPSLKLTIKTDNKDWRGHLEQIKTYRTTINESMTSVKSRLEKLSRDISENMEKITSREKFLNSNLDSLLSEYRTVRDEYFKVNAQFRDLNSGVMERQRKLTRVSEELEALKQEVEERGTVMTDGTPLINIKKALSILKEDVANMNVQIGVLQHDILHSKLQEKLLMLQKVQSQVYA
ncbi:intraflagellar transport protein 57 homolog [Planococcus citri]|uniref:intraflagellar transport protein 57 homolog n=1 Tax=Planococcus citri TaxID=170843 RepID=UPI0031F882F2